MPLFLLNPPHTTNVETNGPTTTTSGTQTLNHLYVGEITLPFPTVLTGQFIYKGSTAAGNVKVGIYDVNGNLLASSASTALSGTFGVQAIPYTAQIALPAGKYFIGVIPSTSTDTFALVCAMAPSGDLAQGAFTMPASIAAPTSGGSYIIHTSTY